MEEISYQDYPTEPVLLDNLSIKFMKASVFVPLRMAPDRLHIVMADTSDFSTIDALRLAYDVSVEAVKGKPDDILKAIDRTIRRRKPQHRHDYRGGRKGPRGAYHP